MDTANTGSDVQGSGGRQSNFKTYFTCHLANSFENQSQRSINQTQETANQEKKTPRWEPEAVLLC